MNADFVADYLADYKYLFYFFCLAILVYRFITVGRKYPLFRSQKVKDSSVNHTSKFSGSGRKINENFLKVREWDISDPRSLEHFYYVKEIDSHSSSDDN
ncbi:MULTISPECIES: hypothetical protein [Enterobacteriaceae]|uniref:Uncharacterized protein n=5 Tax=Enterobacteriaceae TaxID=543 RepID=A0A7G9A7A1_RAOOR|nr:MULTISPECIES: hypothetical protein [Enterobacteriaceae]MDM9661324.1 hypothetical protein [Raoultella planticola]EKW4787500.1 hypothetical protein [Klebsiella variicola]ELS4550630.1 hypothetical protein [Klebsiella michiganensis]KAB8128160.1 hypothetical protein FNH10_26545 [Raoultella ornithinolytica]MBC4622102.1 hypothetical protein [Klebsiella pneumoniae]